MQEAYRKTKMCPMMEKVDILLFREDVRKVVCVILHIAKSNFEAYLISKKLDSAFLSKMVNVPNQQMTANMLMVKVSSESWCMIIFQPKDKTTLLQDKKEKEQKDLIEGSLILENKEILEATDSKGTIMIQGIEEIIETTDNIEIIETETEIETESIEIGTIEIIGIGIDMSTEIIEIIDQNKDSIENTEKEETVVMTGLGIMIETLSAINSTEVTR